MSTTPSQSTTAYSVSVASGLAHIDAMQWTAYMEECLRVLSEKKECPSDELFLCQVRCQLLSQRMIQAPQLPEDVGQPESRVPAAFYLKALQSNLQQIRGAVSPTLQADGESPSYWPNVLSVCLTQCSDSCFCHVSRRVEYLRHGFVSDYYVKQPWFSSTRMSVCIPQYSQACI